MPLDSHHLRDHLNDLRGRIEFLRALQPDNPSYRLWLGDVVELVNVHWGLQSIQMRQLRAVLGRGGRQATGETPAERVQAYLQRLADLDAVMESFLRGIVEPLTLLEERPPSSRSPKPPDRGKP